MNKFPSEINSILNDRNSGSVELLNHLVSELEKELLNTNAGRDSFRRLIIKIRRRLKHFAAIDNLCADLLEKVEDPHPFPSTITIFLNEYRSYWKGSPEKIYTNLLSRYDPAGMTFLTHSNSHTIISLLQKIRENGYSFKALQTHSLPGGEGRSSIRRIQNLGIEAILIEDSEVVDILHSVDMVLMGCDTLLKREFLNKKGTLSIAEATRKIEKPFILIAESRKRIVSETWKAQLKENPLFEWVPLSLVSTVITEQSVL